MSKGTCQICGRAIKYSGKTGRLLARHGYASDQYGHSVPCRGSHWGSFEVTNERIVIEIKGLKRAIQSPPHYVGEEYHEEYRTKLREEIARLEKRNQLYLNR